MSEFIKTQHELRNNLITQVREVLDFADSEARGLDDAEVSKINAIEADIAKADNSITVAQRSEERNLEASVAAKGFIPSVSEERSATDIFRAMASGEQRGHSFERRGVIVGSANTVPKSFYDEVMDLAKLQGNMLTTSEILQTTTGEDLTVPTLSAYSAMTLKGAGAALDDVEPTYSSIVLGALKVGGVIQADNSLVVDAGFDLGAHLAKQAGVGIGTAVNALLTTGTGAGAGQPTGIVTASTLGVTGSNGVAGAFTCDDILDLIYSVDGAVRRASTFGLVMNTASLGAARKLKDTAGNYLYNISQVGPGGQDTFAGFTVHENPDMADTAIDAKSVLAGDLASYKVCLVGGLQVASSTDFAFQNDLTTWRFTMRFDGNAAHASEIKHFVGGAS
jgi:HK97 family phage major capsid protein